MVEWNEYCTPFRALTENELFCRLETSREHADQGLTKDADVVISDLRERYGL